MGENSLIMKLVLDKLPLRDVMTFGRVSPDCYASSCVIYRKRKGRSPIVRIWNSTKPALCNWKLHFHEQLLDGKEPRYELMDKCKPVQAFENFPSIGTIISVGSRSSFEQFIHEDAKLPFRQELIFMTCSEAIVTTPDFSYTGEIEPMFGCDSLVIQSLFLPKSEHFSVKVFALEVSKDQWNPDDVKYKVELPKEDTCEDQVLKAVLCILYCESDETRSFLNSFEEVYKDVSLLAGYGEEFGTNRIADTENAFVVGLSIYTGKGAMASVYEVEFENPSSEIITKIEQEVRSRPHSFCFVFSHDGRDGILEKDEDEFGNWEQFVPPKSRVAEICQELRKNMPRTHIIGIKSLPSVITKNIDTDKTNAQGSRKLCYGILLLSYE